MKMKLIGKSCLLIGQGKRRAAKLLCTKCTNYIMKISNGKTVSQTIIMMMLLFMFRLHRPL